MVETITFSMTLLVSGGLLSVGGFMVMARRFQFARAKQERLHAFVAR